MDTITAAVGSNNTGTTAIRDANYRLSLKTSLVLAKQTLLSLDMQMKNYRGGYSEKRQNKNMFLYKHFGSNVRLTASYSKTFPKSRFANQAIYLHSSRLVDPVELHALAP